MPTKEVDYIMFILLQVQEIYLSFVCYYLRLILPISYSVDLILTIKNPLYPASKRLYRYVALNVLTVLAMLVLTANLSKAELRHLYYMEDSVSQYRSSVFQTFHYMLFYPLIVNPLVSGYAIFISYYTLYEPGIGQKVRNRVIKKQIIFLMINIVCNVPMPLYFVIAPFINGTDYIDEENEE